MKKVFIKRLIATALRNFVSPLAAFLVARHIFPEDQALQIATAIIDLLVNMAFGMAEKWSTHKELTENQLGNAAR
jgi:hypothetical protein